jgi:hypothetical protein
VEASTPAAYYGQAVTFMAAVFPDPPFTGTPTGNVTFYDGTSLLGTKPLLGGTASLTTKLTTLGEQAITVSYSGDTTFAASATGNIIAIAGDGTLGSTGNGGPATSAQLDFPAGVAVDGAGDLFVPDQSNLVIREVNTSGIISVVAGNGTYGSGGDGGPATSAQLSYAAGVAADGAGDLFIADQFNQEIREVNTGGSISTVAGDRIAGYSGNGGPATSAELDYPAGVAVDAAGDLFIADTHNQVIREVLHANGEILTVAGNGTAGYSGDGGKATSAELFDPAGVAVDGAGDVFIADSYNSVVRKVNTSGIISTIAGTGLAGYSGDGKLATKAELNTPTGVAVDRAGDLFIADQYNNVVREVNTSGIITTVAGTGSHGYSGDGGPATKAQLFDPIGLMLDSAGDLFIADSGNYAVRQVTVPATVVVSPDPTMTAVTASTSSAAYGQTVTFTARVSANSPGSGTPTGTVTFYDGKSPLGTKKLSGGTASLTATLTLVSEHIITASYSGDANFAASATGNIVTVAGTGSHGYSGDHGSATSARLYLTTGVAVDAAGDLFIADSDNNVIREVSTSGIITTVAGNYTLGGGYSGNGGPATSARLYEPSGVAVNAAGDLFIADSGNNVVREVNTSGIISTVAGTGIAGYSGNGGKATSAELDDPTGVAVNASGDLFIADTYNNVIREVNPSGIIITVAGTGTAGYSGNGGPAIKAELHDPCSVAVDSSGDMFIADSGNNVVREVIQPTGKILTVAGTGIMGYSGNGGKATNAKLDFPAGVAVDSSGDLFIADTGNSVVREVNSGGIIGTIAGNGTFGHSGDGGPATSAQLFNPIGLMLDPVGDLFIADSANNVVRKVTVLAIVVVSPDRTTTAVAASTSSAVYGQAVTFTATVTVNKPGAGTPTGTVTFYDGKTALGTVKLNVFGQATLTTSQLIVGTHSIAATYDGDADDFTSTSQAVTLTVTS